MTAPPSSRAAAWQLIRRELERAYSLVTAAEHTNDCAQSEWGEDPHNVPLESTPPLPPCDCALITVGSVYQTLMYMDDRPGRLEPVLEYLRAACGSVGELDHAPDCPRENCRCFHLPLASALEHALETARSLRPRPRS